MPFFSRENIFVVRVIHENISPTKILSSARSFVCEYPGKNKKMEYQKASCVRGYHVYRDIWEAVIGEVLQCERERTNAEDRYAVAVKKDGRIIGHLPSKISRVCSLFLRRGGSIRCRITGSRRYSSDLPQGGLEIPCILLFKSPNKTKELSKLKRLLKYS